jgi:tight adherence protein C
MALPTVCLLSFGILFVFVGLALRVMSPDPVGVMLQQYGARPRSLEEIDLSRPFSQRVFIPILRGIARGLNRLTPQSNLEVMRHRLDVAGNPNDWTVVDFLGVRGLSALVFLGISVFIVSFSHGNPVFILLLVCSFTLLGFYVPLVWLNLKARARQTEIQKALPDALDLLTISVEAGLGLDASIQKVTYKWDNELSRGFARVLTEVRVGKLRRDALRDMADRMDVPDVTNFVAAIIQAEQLGVSITNVMRIQSEQMRIKRRQRAQEKAQQAPIKMLIPLAFLIFPSMFIVLLGPAVLRLINRGLLPK